MGTIKRRLRLFSQHCVVLITKSMLKWIFTSQQICIEENFSEIRSYLLRIVMRKKFKYHIDCRYDCAFKFPASEFNTIFLLSFPSEWRHKFLGWHFQVCALKLKKAIPSFCRQFLLQCCARLTHVSFFFNPVFVLCCSAAKLFICSITDAYFTLYFSLPTICINLRTSYGICFTFKVSQKS